jgi:hypothetical protein
LNLTSEQVEAALPRVAAGLAKYAWLQTELSVRDVSRDVEYRKRFGGFYRVRRSADWRDAYFGILEKAKSAPIPFEEALQRLFEATGRVEASFASKLVATVDPLQPVIDSVVLANLGLRLPTQAASDRFARIRHIHRQLAQLYSTFLASHSGRYLVSQFHQAYPDAQVTEIKMLDFVLWQTRPTT